MKSCARKSYPSGYANTAEISWSLSEAVSNFAQIYAALNPVKPRRPKPKKQKRCAITARLRPSRHPAANALCITSVSLRQHKFDARGLTGCQHPGGQYLQRSLRI